MLEEPSTRTRVPFSKLDGKAKGLGEAVCAIAHLSRVNSDAVTRAATSTKESRDIDLFRSIGEKGHASSKTLLLKK
jgi:hypothetical protein